MRSHASRVGAFAIIIFSSIVATLASCPANAGELRDLCPTRPGLGTAPCIVDFGHLLIEIGVGDWTVDRDSEKRTDTLLVGDFLIRYGFSSHDEFQFGWTPFGRVRERDKATGKVARAKGSGDVSVAYKHSLIHPDGNALSIAIQSFVTLPVGGSVIGNHDWSSGLLIPLSFDVTDRVQLQFTPELDGSVDGDGHGRHAAYGFVAGLGFGLSENTGITLEFSSFRDRDPAGHTTELLAGLSATWQPSENVQLDVGGTMGLNDDSSDVNLAVGISTRF